MRGQNTYDPWLAAEHLQAAAQSDAKATDVNHDGMSISEAYRLSRMSPSEKIAEGLRRNQGKLGLDGLSPNAPTQTTAHGGKHSYTGLDFTEMDPGVMFESAGELFGGVQKYGHHNWKGITAKEHLNHALMHIYGRLQGDTQDKHLIHALLRCMMAAVIDRDGVTPR